MACRVVKISIEATSKGLNDSLKNIWYFYLVNWFTCNDELGKSFDSPNIVNQVDRRVTRDQDGKLKYCWIAFRQFISTLTDPDNQLPNPAAFEEMQMNGISSIRSGDEISMFIYSGSTSL